MGLDTTHDCWHGSYGSFSLWREYVAEAAGVPLNLMESFYEPPFADAVEWAAPREGGPLCHDARGPLLHSWIERMTRWLPVQWDSLRPDILHVLLNHSDCDGSIAAIDCTPLADRLEELLPFIHDGEHKWSKDYWREKTKQFISGLRLAASSGEDVEFH